MLGEAESMCMPHGQRLVYHCRTNATSRLLRLHVNHRLYKPLLAAHSITPSLLLMVKQFWWCSMQSASTCVSTLLCGYWVFPVVMFLLTVTTAHAEMILVVQYAECIYLCFHGNWVLPVIIFLLSTAASMDLMLTVRKHHHTMRSLINLHSIVPLVYRGWVRALGASAACPEAGAGRCGGPAARQGSLRHGAAARLLPR